MFVWLSWLLDLIRLNDRGGHAIAWFEYGLAMMLVPGVAAGGGRPDGLSDLNSGWIWASLTAGLGGRDTSGIILGGGYNSSSSSSGSSERKDPSRARASEFGRLPGIGSNVVPLYGIVCCRTTSRVGMITPLVSQLSNPSECEIVSEDCRFE